MLNCLQIHKFSVMDAALAYEHRNNRPLFGLIDRLERERRKQIYDRVQVIILAVVKHT